MTQATDPSTGKRRWFVYTTDGSRKVAWDLTAAIVRERAARLGFRVERVDPAPPAIVNRRQPFPWAQR
jgi:hypothetical protein